MLEMGCVADLQEYTIVDERDAFVAVTDVAVDIVVVDSVVVGVEE